MTRIAAAFSTLALSLLLLPAASAAPRPDDKPAGPALVGQAKSLHDLLEMIKSTVRNVGGEELYKVFEKEALRELDLARLPGIDPKRPFGLYGILDADTSKWRGVVLIPVTSERAFVDMLDQFGIKLARGKEPGAYDVVLPPDVPFPVAVRIHKNYAYVAAGGFDVLEARVILDPRDVINDREKAALFLAVRPDRMTPETKRFLHSAFMQQTDALKETIPEPGLKDAFDAIQRLASRWIRQVLEEGREIAIRVDADTKTGEVSTELSVEGIAKSSLADAISKRPATKNAFATLAGDDFAHRLYATAPLFAPEIKEAAVKLIEYGQKEVIASASRDNAPPEGIAMIEALFKSLKATVESGELDLAAAIRGPNKEGFYTAVGAIHCKGAPDLEKAIRAMIKTLPERERNIFKFDAGKIDDVAVHEIDMSAAAADVARKIFGNGQKAYFAFGKEAIFATYGPDGMKLLKEAMAARPAPAAVLDSSSNGKKAAELIQRMMPAGNPNQGVQVRAGWFESMTSGIRVTVDGGDRLKVRVSYNVAMMFLMGFGAHTAEAPGGAIPVPPVADKN